VLKGLSIGREAIEQAAFQRRGSNSGAKKIVLFRQVSINFFFARKSITLKNRRLPPKLKPEDYKPAFIHYKHTFGVIRN
jgi:hypothetical protein